jgi:hypothetical protein
VHANWTIFRTRKEGICRLPKENTLARNLLYLKSVFIMKYAQFHTLAGALKEGVGSVRKLKTR